MGARMPSMVTACLKYTHDAKIKAAFAMISTGVDMMFTEDKPSLIQVTAIVNNSFGARLCLSSSHISSPVSRHAVAYLTSAINRLYGSCRLVSKRRQRKIFCS
jgi:hypothetical protein